MIIVRNYKNDETYVTVSSTARKFGMNTEELYVIIDHDAECKRRGLTPLLPEPFLINGVKVWSELDLDFILKRLAFRPLLQKRIFGKKVIEGPAKTNAYQRMKIERDYYQGKYEEALKGFI